MNSKGREMQAAIEREVESWPGVEVEFIEGGKHPKVRFTFSGNMLTRPFAGTTSDSAFGVHSMLGDMRRIMKQLGAVRDKPEPSKEEDEAPYRKANDGAAKRRDVRAADPSTPDETLAKKMEILGFTKVADLDLSGLPPLRNGDSIRIGRDTVYVTESDEDDDEDAIEQARAERQARIDAIVDGVYFGLPDWVYHAVPALGSGSINSLIVSAGTFWRGSWLDPNRPELDEEQTAAQLIGKAYHCARLEPDQFEVRFCRAPEKCDFPARGMITSDAAVKAALKEAGAQQTVTGETSTERAERLLDSGYQGTIWPLELALWREEIERRVPIPEPIPGKVWDEIMVDAERLHAVPAVAQLVHGGASEVSVFWTDEHGLRCKARFDKLRAGHWVDFKTFANPRRKRTDQAIADAVRWDRYYVQAVHYRDAAEAIRTGGLQIIGDATDDQRAMIAEIQIRPKELACWYVFQEKGGIPNLLAKRFKFTGLDIVREYEIDAAAHDKETAREALASKTKIATLGQIEIRQAKETFALYAGVYAPGEPWAPIEPMGTIDDYDFSQFWLEGR